MNQNLIILIGCGPQAKYVLEIFSRTEENVHMIFDPTGKKVGEHFGSHIIVDFANCNSFFPLDDINVNPLVIFCIGNNKLKKDLYFKLKNRFKVISAIHPDSIIAGTAVLEKGIIVNAGAVIQPYACIGKAGMIHARVVVEHDCVVGNFVNLAPGVILTGGVIIGDCTTIYSGSIISPNVKIGSNSIIGAGSLVLNDIPDSVIAYGSPAKIIRKVF